MSYGTIKVDTITFTDNSVDKSVSLSGLIQNPTFTGNITVTGTISGDVIRGGTTVSGATVTGTTVLATTGAFTSLTGTTIQGTTATYTTGSFTSLTGTTVTGTTASFTSGVFTNISGTTATITSGIIASGTAAAPSLAILADLDTGVFSPGANQLAVATNGTGRLFVDASGRVGVGTPTPDVSLHVKSAGSSIVSEFEATAAGFSSIDLSNTAGYARLSSVAGNLALSPAGTERLRITSAGLVGIGTSGPRSRLDVRQAADSTFSGFSIGASGSDKYIGIGYSAATTSWNIHPTYDTTGGYSPLAFNVGGNEALRIDTSQRVGIGTTSPGVSLEVAGPTGDNLIATFRSGDATAANNTGGGFRSTSSATATSRLAQLWLDADGANLSGADYFAIEKKGNSGNVDLRQYSNAAMTFWTYNQERARIDSSGRLLVGTSTARGNFFGTTGQEWRFQIEGVGYLNAAQAIIANSGDALGSYLNFAKTRGSSVGSNTIVQSGDALGVIDFHGADGTDFAHGARITAEVDGTPGNNDLPTRLVFSTTADGAATPTERLRITSAGLVGIGTSAPSAVLDVRATSFTPTNTGSALLLEDRTVESQALHFYLNNAGVYAGSRLSGGIGAANAFALRVAGGGIITGNFASGTTNFTPSDTSAGVISVAGNIQFFTKGSLTAGTGTDLAGSERMRIDSSGNVGIGTTSASFDLTVEKNVNSFVTTYIRSTNTGSSAGGRLIVASAVGGLSLAAHSAAHSIWPNTATITSDSSFTGGLVINAAGTNPLQFYTNSSERARIDSSGRLLVGTSSARSNFFNTSTIAPSLQVEGTTYGSSSLSLIANGNVAAGNPFPIVVLGRTRGTSVGSTTVVSAGDSLGSVSYQGSDGTEFVEAAIIAAEVDGTPGANDMPGRLVFSTTADGAASPTERLRITSAGLVGIGTSAPAELLHVSGTANPSIQLSATNDTTPILNWASNGSDRLQISSSSVVGANINVRSNQELRLSTNSTERLRITSGGLVGIGSSAPAYILETSQGGSGGVVVGASLAASGNGGVGRGVGLMFKAPGSANSVEVARIDGRQNTANGTANDATLNFMVANTSGTLTERLTIDSSGRLLVGTSTANASGAKLQTADGLTFPATQVASADPNTLDDYEEGTWTPNQGSGLTLVGTFSSIGRYTKIGNMVTVWGQVTGSTSVSVSSTGVVCTNLPFALGGSLGINGIATGYFTADSAAVHISVGTPSSVIACQALSPISSIGFTITYAFN
jgi:hypothetical protein